MCLLSDMSFTSVWEPLTGHFLSSLRRVTGKPLRELEGASLLQTFTGSIMPRLTSNIFLPTGCTIRSLLSGLGSGGCVGSKKWALSHWIMPLFQLLWPGMPNFTARYSSLCVNQSFARGRGAHWVRLQLRASPATISDPTIDPSQTTWYMLISNMLFKTVIFEEHVGLFYAFITLLSL